MFDEEMTWSSSSSRWSSSSSSVRNNRYKLEDEEMEKLDSRVALLIINPCELTFNGRDFFENSNDLISEEKIVSTI